MEINEMILTSRRVMTVKVQRDFLMDVFYWRKYWSVNFEESL